MRPDPITSQRRRRRPATQISNLQAEIHGELFSLERLEEYARELATQHKSLTRRVPARPLLAEAEKSGRKLEEAYTRLADATGQNAVLMPGDEWLLDNYHIVRDTVDEIEVDLPRRYYLQLPRLGEGPWTGYPRVYSLVRELIQHSDGIVDSANVEAFTRGYQSVLTLDLGELWALPAMIRLALVENLARLADLILDARRQLEAANMWADRLVAMIEDPSLPSGAIVGVPAELRRNIEQITPAFVARLVLRIREAGPEAAAWLTWLERELANAGYTPEDAIRIEFSRQAALQASVGNTISSMRRVSATNWDNFVERHSAVEALLRTDPAGVYAQMDFSTRDRYRHTVERIARRAGKPEVTVAEQALRFAVAAREENRDDTRRSHVGYYLVARGVHQLREATGYKSRLGETLSRFVRAYPTAVYIGSILGVTFVCLLALRVFGFSGDLTTFPLWAGITLLLAILPASELATRLVNLAVTLLLPPRVLPKLDLSAGIPLEYSTFVVIPTLLKDQADVQALADRVEVLYFANQDPNLRFAILSDFPDAPQEEMPYDDEVLKAACEAIEQLNARHGGPDRFYLFHRKRQWNPTEGVWMGWERKRGKLADFNALLRSTEYQAPGTESKLADLAGYSVLGIQSSDKGGESFTKRVGDLAPLGTTRYVITLDSDTDLPRDAARRLIGAIAHPLNRAELDPCTGIVKVGYGILQPSVETTWESASKTPFSRIFSGHTGIDPYTTAVSNAYQDLFGEGSFIGKGIYEVDVFEQSIRERFPRNAILSHDLLEGAYARVGLVSDIELYDDIPSSYNAFAARSHRWVRGDWQIAGWVLPYVRSEAKDDSSRTAHRRVRNVLSLINRWKIGDNLRRSLVAPASVLLLAVGWAAPLLSPIVWTLFVLLVYAFPFYSHLMTALPRRPASAPWSRHFAVVFTDAGTNLLHLLLTLTSLAHTAYMMLDAVARTLVRMNITRRHLLEWVTASETQRRLGTGPLDFVKRMWQAWVISALVGLTVLIWKPEAAAWAAPFLIAWTLSPLVAYRVSQPFDRETYIVTEDDERYLRRVARKSWRYFEEFVGEQDRWLAPDNYQEYPRGVVAHRTSPTNLSLLLLSTLSAHDLGYITLSEMVARIDRTFSSMESLEKYNGHFYNWYDTRTGQPLAPRYVSTVDSGNLAAHLLALKNGCVELIDAPLFSPQLLQNLRDIIELMETALGVSRASSTDRNQTELTRYSILGARDTLTTKLEAIAERVRLAPSTVSGWIKLTTSIHNDITNLASEARKLAGSGTWTPPTTPDTGTPQPMDEFAYWADSLARAVQALEKETSALVPWANYFDSPPSLLEAATAGDPAQSSSLSPQSITHRAEIAAHWTRLKKLSEPLPSLSGTLAWCTACVPEIRRLQARIREADLGEGSGPGRSDALRWLEQLSQRVSASWAASEALSNRLGKLANRADAMARAMNFAFLYDQERKLFTIGYNVAELRPDHSYYDLLASEARQASYLAIARGEVPQAHWFRMGRPVTGEGRYLALISWTGTTFEYLMPNLVMPQYSASLLDQTCTAIVRYQEQYGRQNGIPWGISESAYNALDSDMSYRYRAFGVPGLGLKRGLSDDLVVAPYATQLALPVEPRMALANLRRLSSLGVEGRYGFYDAIDFTRSRLTSDEYQAPATMYQVPRGIGTALLGGRYSVLGTPLGAVVRTFMVHHIGMGLVAMNNFLNGNPMVRRFEAEPDIKATLLLLQERIPRQAAATQPHPAQEDRERTERELLPPVVRRYNTPHTDVPRAHLISNGRYTVMVTNSGAGYSRWGLSGSKALAITRWRDDWVRDACGTFIYLRDVQSGTMWSAAAAPFCASAGQPAGAPSVPSGYDASFGLDKADFLRRDGDIETHMEVTVSPEDDAEIRRVTLTNRGSRRRTIELTSYAEIALAEQSADESHPAFSKLFVETEYLPSCGALIASRRPRSSDEQRKWLVHVVAVGRQDGTTGNLGSPFPEEYETDRLSFLGRGGTPAAPRAITEQPLGNSSGAVLDPIFSLRQRVRIDPGTRVQVSFVMAVAETREEALALSDKYHDAAHTERAVRMALTHARLELRMLDISVDEAMQYQRVFSRMIYPRRGTRPSETTLAKNSKGQSGLWAYGISGDLSILLVRIADPLEVPLVRQAIRAHEFWLTNGFEADLVILNEYPGGYIQPVQDELERLVAASHARSMLNKPGGIFVKRADIMPEADRILLNSVARVVLVGSRGTLDAQLDREVPEQPLPPLLGRTEVKGLRTEALTARQDRAQPSVLSPQSSFSPDGREYVITLNGGERTPLPWSNIIANRRFGCLVSESSLGTTWAENSQANRLTPWSNDPVSDPPSEVIYVRDDESGAVTTPTPLPVRDNGPYTIKHGQGYTIYSHESEGIEQTLRVSVPPDDPVKTYKLTLRNLSGAPRRLSITYYAELVLGVSRESVGRYVITEADREHAAILARNPYNSEFAERVAFATTDARTFTFTADRAEFLGRNGSVRAPAALRRRALSGRVGASPDPCMALQCPVQLQPGEERSIIFALGDGDNAEHARLLATRYRDPEEIEEQYRATVAMWNELLSAVQVETPDGAMNHLLNRWLLYQSVSCRIWGRTAFYQSSGAYGFRDQLQDVMALTYSEPGMAREQILLCASRQFKEGDVQHWWHPPSGRGVRTHFSDDLLWLPFVTAHYVEATGDTAILDEKLPFLQAPLLTPDQEDMYGTPTVSEETGSLYEHCLRAIARGSTSGAHGLPLMGTGDWNDGMNRVGVEGKGESVWVGWFLYATLSRFAPICDARSDKEHVEAFRNRMSSLKSSLEKHAWDGEWYLRAFYDNGQPLGSARSDECRIDSIAQSWGVISGAADPSRAAKAMRAVDEQLVRDKERMLLLFTPPFDMSPQDPGYIKGYPSGVRENGGQYTHAATWTALARVLMGDGDGAYRLFDMMNPVNHARTSEEIERYKVEPYVIAADIYSHPQHVGRGGWTWYTGSASWYYRVGVEYILGLKLRGDHFTVEPCIPSHWPGYSMVYRHGKSTTYHISVENKEGSNCQVQAIELDGASLPDRHVPLVDDSKEHEVRVVMGTRKAAATAAKAGSKA